MTQVGLNVRHKVSDSIFYILVAFICIFAFAVTLVPFIHVLVASFSDIRALVDNKVYLFPVGFDLTSYKEVLGMAEVWTSYYNTIWYTVVGTVLSLAVTLPAAYALSRKNFYPRRKLLLFFAFTMYFNGGLIPFYRVVNGLGLYGTRWAMILPVLLNVFNLIICRTSFEETPEEIFESARLDGCSDFRLFFNILLPLQKGIIAVIAMYYAVANWNSFFNALLFLPDRSLQPLQLFLRRVVIQSSPEILLKMGADSLANDASRFMMSMQMKYAVVIVSIGPILLVYPFVQKYLVKGVMIGAIK